MRLVNVIGLCYVSLTAFSVAISVIYDCLIHYGHTGIFPMDHILDFNLVVAIYIETEVTVWYVYIAGTMPQCRLECFTVRYPTAMELLKIYMLESIRWKVVNLVII